MPKLALKKEYKKYPAYKNIQIVENIDIPKGWDVNRITTIGSLSREKGGGGDLLSVYLDRGVIKASEGSLGTHAPKDDLSSYQSVKKGDFILNNQQAWRGSVGVSELNGLISPAYIIFRFNEGVFPRYYNYLCRSNIVIDQFRLLSKGVGNIQRQIHASALKSTKIIIPPKGEQEKIANFLDEKIALIDIIIEKKQKLIELLKEKRSAVINHAVTKGLDPEAELVDSGVEWIGEIPKEWEMRKIFHLFKIIGSGTTPDASYLSELDSDIPWVNTGDLTDNIVTHPSKRVKKVALDKNKTLRLYDRDSLIIAMYGATIGKLGIPNFEFCTNQACCVLADSYAGTSLEYVYYWLLGNKKYIVELGKGGGQPNINKEDVKSMKVSMPMKQEQIKIVSFLDSRIPKYETTIELTEKSVVKLQEFKSSLISHAVTGKIKV